jgi:hypothetical protein
MVIDDCNGTKNVPVLEVPLGSIDELDIVKDVAAVCGEKIVQRELNGSLSARP